MHAAIAAAPSDVRDMFLAPVSGWKHYLDLEWLFDQLLAERGGKKLTPEERADFEEMMRAFGHDRPRGRAALRRTVDIAEGIGEVVFGRHLAATGSALTAEAREMGEIKLAEIKAQAGVREKQQPEKERRHG